MELLDLKILKNCRNIFYANTGERLVKNASYGNIPCKYYPNMAGGAHANHNGAVLF